MFAPSIPGRMRTFAPRPHSKRSIHASAGLRSLTSARRRKESVRGFTLFELLVVMALIAILMVLIAPAFTNIKSGTDVTSAAYTVKSVLDSARTYAKANNTYTWVGFYEEDVSKSSTTPASSGVGRLVMSIAASKDGTMLYTGNLTSSLTLDASPNQAALIQVGKLVKIDNLHLKTFPAATSTPPPDAFDTRPAVTSTASQIGDTTPPNPALTFHYPLGTSPGQYAFTKVVQFSPRGEAVVTNNSYTLAQFSEIGVEPTHGAAVPASTPANIVAVQFNGFAGDVKIYRK
jgi:prepilin-type N-terminal cleavage/methylation domain-containing protein